MGHSRQETPTTKKTNVLVYAFNNCLTSSVIGMLDVFEICNQFWKMQTNSQENIFEAKLISLDGKEIRSFNAIPIYPTLSLDQADDADIVIIPPVMNQIDKALIDNNDLIPWINQLHAQGCVITSVCTGIFFLGQSGLLDGKTATTNPLMANMFRQYYPDVTLDLNQIMIAEDRLVTSGPTYAFVDLVIYLVEKYCGNQLALQCSKLLLHDKNRNTMTPYFISSISHSHQDQEIHQIQHWLETHSAKSSISLDSLAKQFHMSPRNLSRRFQKSTGVTPLNYLQELRINEAKGLLENTQKNIDEITQIVGYSDSKSFGRLFRKHVTLSPSEYRKRFSCRL